jgi:hypothetical protein
VSPKDDDWRLPALKKFGEQIRREEESDARQRALRRQRRRPVSARAGILLGTLGLIAAVLSLVTTAGALSPINHAPAAAARSRSVRFSSTLEVRVNGRRFTRFAEQGAINFVTRDYATTLALDGPGGEIERRRTGNVLYVIQRERDVRARAEWHRLRPMRARGSASIAPGGYTLIDPQVVFRVLAGARSPITIVGHAAPGRLSTTHYRLSTTLAAFLAAEGTSVGAGSPFANTPAEMDVWLDRSGRPRRVEVSFAGVSRLGSATVTMVVEFSGYGAPVLVRAPRTARVSASGANVARLSDDPLRLLELLLFSRPR